jgi:putative tryptophan/tyrosine transport system substrate-binding protein
LQLLEKIMYLCDGGIKRKFLLIISFFIILLTGLFLTQDLQPAYCESKNTLYIIKSRSLPPYDYICEKVRQAEELRGFNMQIKIFDTEGDASKIKSICEEIRNNPPNLILSIGTEVTVYLAENKMQIPAVFTMVYETDRINKIISGNENLRGVFLNLDMDAPLDILKEICPDIKKIGALYMPEHFESQLNDMENAAKGKDIQILRKEMRKEEDIPEAIRQITTEIDAFYMLPEPFLMKSEMIKKIILTTLPSNVFVFGETFDIVEKGALAGFAFDLNAITDCTVRMTKKYMDSGNIAEIKNHKCEKFSLYLNNRTAQRLGITFSKNIREMAKKIIE